MRLFGGGCFYSFGSPKAHKGRGGALRGLLLPVPSGVLGRLGGRPGPGSGTTVRAAAGQEDSGSGGLRSWSLVTAGPRWMYHVPGFPLLVHVDADVLKPRSPRKSGDLRSVVDEEGIVTVISVPQA